MAAGPQEEGPKYQPERLWMGKLLVTQPEWLARKFLLHPLGQHKIQGEGTQCTFSWEIQLRTEAIFNISKFGGEGGKLMVKHKSSFTNRKRLGPGGHPEQCHTKATNADRALMECQGGQDTVSGRWPVGKEMQRPWWQRVTGHSSCR